MNRFKSERQRKAVMSKYNKGPRINVNRVNYNESINSEKAIKKFDRFARELKEQTLSHWSAWRYVIDTDKQMLTFNETKEKLKTSSNPQYVKAYFKTTYWGNMRF